MIFVDRALVPIPQVLVSDSARAANEKIRALLASASKDHLAQLRVTLNERLWIAAKPALLQLFHSKCAYCETPIASTQSGDIEHFRPKQGAQSMNGDRQEIYYSWLAYEWENLLISCIECGRQRTHKGRVEGKGALFPLSGARAPMSSSVAECRALEKGTLVDPCFDRPEEHFTFLDTGSCSARTERGAMTLHVLALNRQALQEQRRAAWLQAQTLVDLMAVSTEEAQRRSLRERLVELLSGRQGYTAVARAMMAQRFGTTNLPAMFGADVVKLAADLRIGAVGSTVVAGAPVQVDTRPSALPYRFPHHAGMPPFAQERIRRVEIRNFKAIESLDLDFQDLPTGNDDNASGLMLIGENATGKSSILQAIALALVGTEQIAKLGLRASDYLRRDQDWDRPSANTARTEIRVFFEDSDQCVSVSIDPKTETFQGNTQPAVVLLGYGPRRFFTDGGGLWRRREAFARVKTLFNPTAVITNPSGWLMNCGEAQFSAAVRALRQLLLLSDEAVVVRPTDSQRNDSALMFDMDGIISPLNRLSEGYKTIAAMSVDVMREMLRYWSDLERARGVVLIDEVETHLHPRWKMRIMQRLRRAMPQVQFIATTHDPLCLRGLFDGEVKVLRRTDGAGIEQVTDLPNVQGLSVEQLLTSDFFGLFSTEDPQVEEEMLRYVTLATKRDRTPDDEGELSLHRDVLQQSVRVGTTSERQLVQEAMSKYLIDRRAAPERERGTLRRDALEKVVDIWKSMRSADEAT